MMCISTCKAYVRLNICFYLRQSSNNITINILDFKTMYLTTICVYFVVCNKINMKTTGCGIRIGYILMIGINKQHGFEY